MRLSDEIEKLHNLKMSGAISEDEFQAAKASLLAGQQSQAQTPGGIERFASDLNLDVNTWSMFIHLSQFCGYLMPVAGLIVPIVLWQIKKDDDDVIDLHGRVVINWIISSVIYWVIAIVLCFVVVGFALVPVLAVVGIIFPVVGAVKASKGEVWPYPVSIAFFPLHEGDSSRTSHEEIRGKYDPRRYDDTINRNPFDDNR